MAEEESAKQSELAELTKVINELRQSSEGKEKKPWVLTPARAKNFARAAEKRRANIEKRKREQIEREAFEAERKAFYEMAASKPNGMIATTAPNLEVNTMTPNIAPAESSKTLPETVQKHDASAAPAKEEKVVRFIEKPIMADEVEPVAGEHDYDDGWMTSVKTAAPKLGATLGMAEKRDAHEDEITGFPLHRQQHCDPAELHRKRARDEIETERYYPIGTGAGNHAPYENDHNFVSPGRNHQYSAPSYSASTPAMVSAEEALQLLSMPKDVALRCLAQYMSQPQVMPHDSRMLRGREEIVQEPVTADHFLSHTRHHAARHPSQLHNASSSSRYQRPGDEFLWI